MLVVLLVFTDHVQSLNFSFPSFNPNTPNITYRNDSTPTNGAIQLTINRAVGSLSGSVGRASYNHPVRLWDQSSNRTTNFTTHFSFDIIQVIPDPNYYGDGIAFFIAPFDDSANAPADSFGGCLGLIGRGQDESCNSTTEYPFVAVEFDTFHNAWDPGESGAPSNDHVGINVNSVFSRTNFRLRESLKNRTTGNAWITYDSSTNNLSVFLSYDANPVFNGESNLSYVIDLSSILPERVRVGFSSSTGANYELHNILSWNFNSTLEDRDIILPAPRQSNNKAALVGGIVAGVSALLILLGLVAFMWWRRKRRDDMKFDVDDDFDEETGPRRFTYKELSQATNNFNEEGKLGEGGFGGVYRGFMTVMSREIAVKKISRGSKQGKKEYVSEVKAISRLRHKNLVQLLGWCHEQGHLLLVYEYMPNGSLDSHLYTGKRKVVLPWDERYRIAQGLASAVLYLHEEWEQCVLHRDIKSSNVMLDSNFNAKLGDFGLARLVDHNLGSQTTEEASKVSMIEWVWRLYGEGNLLEAVDKTIQGEFDIQQIECLMVVGLWCCHPEYTFRPSIRQVINVLNLESPLPNLPMKFPVPVYCSPPTNVKNFYISSSSSSSSSYSYSSSGFTGSSTGTTSSSSQSVVSGTAPLLSQNLTV
ncbi:hypothetical protein SOVF_074680 [Spinacia oleracea]|nr:hypothetical protein SOVF_074680 [Spinacia oleracea]